MLLERYRVWVDGPLEPWADGFASELESRGYARLSIPKQLRLFAYTSRWLHKRRLRPCDLTPARVERLLHSRRCAGYTGWRSVRGIAPLLDYLRAADVVPPVGPTPLRTFLDLLLARYHEYLVQERGLVAAVVRVRCDIAGKFLALRRSAASVRAISASDVRTFFRKQSRGFSTGWAATVATALRSLLRFLHVQGRIPAPLGGALPSIPGWRLTSLPQALTPGAVRKLLRSCDRRRLIGLRDYAALLLLVRLGLRTCEVVRLEFDDLDWRRGEIVVRGKGKTVSRLPLPKDVGAALSAYLVRRPRVAYRSVFLQSTAPVRPVTTNTIKSRVAVASRRAGLPRVTPHNLRHTVATEMLRRGGSLAEIAQVLRHRSLASTAIYAKVDRTALLDLAQPWPGRGGVA